jgi:hypothetical protein
MGRARVRVSAPCWSSPAPTPPPPTPPHKGEEGYTRFMSQPLRRPARPSRRTRRLQRPLDHPSRRLLAQAPQDEGRGSERGWAGLARPWQGVSTGEYPSRPEMALSRGKPSCRAPEPRLPPRHRVFMDPRPALPRAGDDTRGLRSGGASGDCQRAERASGSIPGAGERSEVLRSRGRARSGPARDLSYGEEPNGPPRTVLLGGLRSHPARRASRRPACEAGRGTVFRLHICDASRARPS